MTTPARRLASSARLPRRPDKDPPDELTDGPDLVDTPFVKLLSRLLPVPVALLGLVAAGAVASTQRASGGYALGTITALTSTSIKIDADHDLTCSLNSSSPTLAGFAVGDRVGIACSGGVLVKIAKVPSATYGAGKITALSATAIIVAGRRTLTCAVGGASPALGSFSPGDAVGIACTGGVLTRIRALPTIDTAGGTVSAIGATSITVRDLTCKITADSPDTGGVAVGDKVGIACSGGVLVKLVKAPAEPSNATTGGSITALSTSSITVAGEHPLTCRLTGDSPDVTGYKVGDQVGVGCAGGVLVQIIRIPINASTSGAIAALSAGSITVDAEHERDLTCKIGAGSPDTGAYKLGDQVGIVCTNGLLVRIVRLPLPPTASGTTTTSTAGAVGEIKSLGSGSITIDSDHDLTCTIDASSPGVAGYSVGDKVKIGCTAGILAAITRTDVTLTVSFLTTSTSSYAAGEIATLSTAAIKVDTDRDLTCTLNASSPSLAGFKVGDRVKIGCVNAVLVGIVRIDSPPTPTTTTTTTTATTTTTPTTTAVTATTTVTTTTTTTAKTTTENVATSTGTLTAIGSGSVTVSGLTCARRGGSPNLDGYRPGDSVRIYCSGGALIAIARV